MSKYVASLQAKIYRLDATILQARRNGDIAATKWAEQILNETLYELKQAEFMES